MTLLLRSGVSRSLGAAALFALGFVLVPLAAPAHPRNRRAAGAPPVFNAAAVAPSTASVPPGLVGIVSQRTQRTRRGVLLETDSCTGFVVPTTSGTEVIATARHCITHGGRMTVFDATQRATALGALAPGGGPDVALVQADPRVAWPTVELADSRSLANGDVLCAWRVRTAGRRIAWDRVCGRFLGATEVDTGSGAHSVLLVEHMLSPGFSGGPVMDAAGRVVGVSVATTREGFDLVEPVEHLEELAMRTTAEPPAAMARGWGAPGARRAPPVVPVPVAPIPSAPVDDEPDPYW